MRNPVHLWAETIRKDPKSMRGSYNFILRVSQRSFFNSLQFIYALILLFFFPLWWIWWGISDNRSYPKGLIVAFKLKPLSKEGSTEQNGIHLEEENVDGNKTERSTSPGNVTLESEQKASGNDNDGDKKSSEDVTMDRKNLAEDLLDGIKEKPAKDATEESEDTVTEDPPPENEVKPTHTEEIVTREDLKLALQKFGAVMVWWN